MVDISSQSRFIIFCDGAKSDCSCFCICMVELCEILNEHQHYLFYSAAHVCMHRIKCGIFWSMFPLPSHVHMQVNLKSTNLETHLFKKVLSGLIGRGVSIKEVVTDANCQIISVMSEFPFKSMQ